MCSVDDSEHYEIEVYLEPQLPPSPREFTERMWTEVNQLGQESLPPKYSFFARRSSARSLPQHPCSDSRVATDKGAMEPERGDKNKRREIPLVQVFGKKKIKCKMKPF